MNLQQAAARLDNCSTKTVRRRINSGELRASRIGRGLWEISETDLQAYLDLAADRPREISPLPAPQTISSTTTARNRRYARTASDGRLSLQITDDMGKAA